jgi:hypothetical protein
VNKWILLIIIAFAAFSKRGKADPGLAVLVHKIIIPQKTTGITWYGPRAGHQLQAFSQVAKKTGTQVTVTDLIQVDLHYLYAALIINIAELQWSLSFLSHIDPAHHFW